MQITELKRIQRDWMQLRHSHGLLALIWTTDIRRWIVRCCCTGDVLGVGNYPETAVASASESVETRKAVNGDGS